MNEDATTFADRFKAGRALTAKLEQYFGRPNVVVLGLARGGVPVAYEIAKSLKAPLNVFIVRKLGVPGHEEMAMGAVASGGICVINEDVVNQLNLNNQAIEQLKERGLKSLRDYEKRFGQDQEHLNLKDKAVILVDDGLATGASMKAAVEAVKEQEAERVVVAVPVGAPESLQQLHDADEVICLITPIGFQAVGYWYENFEQVSDEEVRRLLSINT